MRHRALRCGMTVAVALMTLCLLACRQPFTPEIISADVVPQDVRDSVHPEASEVVWHLSQPDWHQGLSLYAATCTIAAPDGVRHRTAHIIGIPANPDFHRAAMFVFINDRERFWGVTGRGVGIIEGDDDATSLLVSIEAGGYCFDSRASEIVALTSEGREFRCPVTNGFWLISVQDAVDTPSPNPVQERWSEITARSASGKVLYQLDLGVSR